MIIFRSDRSHMLFKTGVLKNFTIFTGKYLCWSLFLMKFNKETPTQSLSCEYREIFKNTFFNPLQPGVAFLYPLKTSENLKVFRCFQGV